MKSNKLHPALPFICCLLSSCSLEGVIPDMYQCLDDHSANVDANAMNGNKCSDDYHCPPITSSDVIPDVKVHLCYRCDDTNQRFDPDSRECRDFVCTDGEYSCLDNQVMKCRDGELTLYAKCASGMSCDANNGSCIAPKNTCKEDTFSCDGQILKQCKDGDFIEISTCIPNAKCDAEQGKCIDSSGEPMPTCENGKFRCSGKVLMKCENGQETEAETCADEKSCNAEQGKCAEPPCVENAYSCSGQKLIQCKNGQDTEVKTCTDDMICDPESGDCVEPPCTENTYKCDGQNLMQCSGGVFIENKTCTDDTICSAEAGDCREPPCNEGEFTCDDQNLMKCMNGSFALHTACKADETCNAPAGRCDEPVGECTGKTDGTLCTGTGTKSACGQFVCVSNKCIQTPIAKDTICREAAGDCDIAERCNGTSLECPADAFKAKGTQCREAQHSCDNPETCDGNGPACPALKVENTCKCPAANTANSSYNLKEGSGVTPFKSKSDYAGFILKDDNTWDKNAQAIDALGTKVSATALVNNHTMSSFTAAYTGFAAGYKWINSDTTSTVWEPQGIAGGSHNEITIRVVSWNYVKKSDSDEDKGVRVSFINTTGSPKEYRHVLLVELSNDEKKIKAVKNAGGGLVWKWPYLYETDTNGGLRVFDMTRIIKVSAADECETRIGTYNGKICAYKYAYVMPQINYYKKAMSDSCSDFKFSFSGLERLSSHSILTGEFFSHSTTGATCVYSRMVRYPFGSSGKLKTTNGYVEPSGGWFTGDCNIQGGTTITMNNKDYFLLTSSRNYGTLFRSTSGSGSSQPFKATSGQISYAPQGIYPTTSDNVWIVNGSSSTKNSERSLTIHDVATLLK